MGKQETRRAIQVVAFWGVQRWRLLPRPLFAVLILLLPLWPLPAVSNIFGADDRRPLQISDRLSAVGLIECDGTTRLPTASVIELPGMQHDRTFDVIISVAHAFYSEKGKRWNNCRFLPRSDTSQAIEIVEVAAGTKTPGKTWDNDWSVAILAHRVNSDITPLQPLKLEDDELFSHIDCGAQFILAGHDGERRQLLVSEHCGPRRKKSGDINLRKPNQVNHDCDMISGWSGGPLVMREGNFQFVIAVNSTAINAIAHRIGTAYRGHFNPNTAVRIGGDFLDAIHAFAGIDAGKKSAPMLNADKGP